MAAKRKGFLLPKTMGACADLLYATRKARLAMQKQADVLEERENALKEHFIQNLSKNSATGIAGKVARVQILPKVIPVVDDWPKLYQHVKKTGEFELFQRRVNAGAVEERWQQNKQVPGIGRFNAKTVSCTAVKGGR